MNRLQVGGLALSTDTGTIVTLIEFLGDCFDIDTDIKYFSVWHVRDSCFQVSHTGETVIEYGVESKFLIPLGDDKGIEIYKLQAERNATIGIDLAEGPDWSAPVSINGDEVKG